MMTNSTRLYDAFEVCLAAMGTGVDLETCLALYPDLAGELRPALQTAQNARLAASSQVPEGAMRRSRARMQSRAAELRSKRRVFGLPAAFPRLAMAALALVLAIFLSLNGLAVVSAKALPGDTLYPVKRAAENVRLQLAGSSENRLHIEEQYQQRRADEIRNLLSQGSMRSVSFEGLVEEADSQRLLIEGLPVEITPDTQVIGEILPGRLVEVEGSTQAGGWIEAHELHLRFYEYAGELKEIQSGLWTIGEAQFKILRGTHLEPALQVGDQVLALVFSSDDGSQYAQAILRLPEVLVSQDDFEPFEIEFSGAVEAISGNSVVVAGKTVLLTGATEIEGALAVGAVVEIHAIVAADGSLTAREIEMKDASGSGDDDDFGDDSGQDDSDDDDDDGDNGDNHSGDDDDSGSDDDDGSDDGNSGSDDDDGSDDDNSGSDDDDDGGSDDDNSGSDDDNDDDSDDDNSGSDDDDRSDDDSSGGEGED